MKLDKKKIGVIIACLLVVVIVVVLLVLNANKKYTIDFTGIEGYNSVEIKKGETIAKPKDPEKEGYTFEGWYSDGKLFDFNTKIKENIQLEARFKRNVYTVTFDSNKGSKVEAKEVSHGDAVAKPETPTRKGYTFVEWRLNGKKYDFSNAVTENITLKAVWKKGKETVKPAEVKVVKYTVTFDAANGSAVKTQEVEKGNTVAKPKDPTREGYTFEGWTLNGNVYDFKTPVTGNITLKAIWKLIPIDLSKELAEAGKSFKTDIYNMFKEVNLTEEDLVTNDIEDIFYVDLGEYKGTKTPTKMTIEGTTYSNETYEVSIGNDGHINARVWKIEENAEGVKHLYVAYPWLSVEALPEGETLVTVGDQEISVIAYDATKAKLVIDNIEANKKEGYTSVLSVEGTEVNYKLGYGTNTIGVLLKDEKTNDLIDNTDLLVFRKDVTTGKMGVTTPEYGYTYLLYPAYKDGAFTEAKVLNDKVYKLAIPTVGVIELTFKITKVEDVVAPEELTEEPVVLTEGVEYIDGNFAVSKEGLTVFKYVVGEVTYTATKVGSTWKFGADFMEVMNKQGFEFTSRIYNQLTNVNIDADKLVELGYEDVYYVDLGEYTGTNANPTKLTIHETNYNAGETYKLSIGNNSYIEVPVWKIAEDENGVKHVYVAYPWLSVEALPAGITDIKVADQVISIVAYAEAKANLSIESAEAQGKAGYTSELKVNGNKITYVFGNGTNTIGVLLSDGTTTYTDESLVVFRKDLNSNAVGITTPESGYTYLLYPMYNDGEFTDTVNVTRNYKLAIPGVGVIEIELDLTAVEEVKNYTVENVIEVLTEGVKYTENGFVILTDVETFEFTDGEKQVVATKENGTWTFAEENTSSVTP